MRGLAERVAVMKRVWAGEKTTDSVRPVGPPPVQAGGPPLLVATAVVALVAMALGLLTLVRVGGTDGRGWRAALAWSMRLLAVRPWLGLVLVLVVALPALLASAIPVTAPLLVGFGLFALHVVVRRTAG